MKKRFIPLQIAVTAFNAVVATTFLVGNTILNLNSAAVNMALQIETYKMVQNEDEDPEASIRFKSDYGEVDGEILQDEDRYICEEVEGEGIALLWNENQALPLIDGDNVSLFSMSSQEIVETGSGSGYISTRSYSSNLKDALTDDGININMTLWNFYSSRRNQYRRTTREGACTENQTLSVNECPWSQYDNNTKSSFAQFGDAAIIVLSRTGGEYSDLKNHGVDTHGSNYLNLSNNEVTMFENVVALKKSGTFSKIVLLINSGNPIQMGELEAFREDIDACMYVGQPGTYGTKAIADCLVGIKNPSGSLTDTWCYDNTVAPACFNDMDYTYSNTKLTNRFQTRYMVYQEGIYVGYRYFETRYEDYILNQGNPGEFDYDSTVDFPFGHGLSYTTFEYSNFAARKVTGGYELTVSVKNTGTVKGKKAVQFYMQKPYTNYDKVNGLEKSSIELCAYGKTGYIKPGETIEVKKIVEEKQLRTYDFANKETYIAEAGDYYFAVGTDAHNALNNVLAAKGKNSLINNDGNQNLAKKFTLANNFADFTKDDVSNKQVENHLNDGDLNYYEQTAKDEPYVYLSRNDWTGTFPTSYTRVSSNTEMDKDLGYDFAVDEDDERFADKNGLPKYEQESPNHVVAATLIGQDFDNPYWDELLDQMTWVEQAYICANAYHNIPSAQSINFPGSNQENGPVGITQRSDFARPSGPDYQYVAYPNAPIMGGTFNDKLIEEMGQHISEDMLYTKYNGIYGPGANLHRTAFSGRAWEYPGEDPYLTGMICAAEIKGIQSKGCIAYAKHFALNDLETNRRHVSIWATEQTSREIYLNAFEIAFKKGDCRGTMNSFTRVGTKWCGACKELITDILRDEWGWQGINITDWRDNPCMSYVDAMVAGTDSYDGNANAANKGAEFARYKDSKVISWRLRESCKRVIYNVLKTNATNGLTSATTIVEITPWWHTATLALGYSFLGLTGITGALLGLSIFFKIKEKKVA